MGIIHEELIKEFSDFKKANPNNFHWWSYLNIKSDLQTAIAFSKLFSPDVMIVEDHFLLRDRFNDEIFQSWKKNCNGEKKCVEKMLNLYELKDFFHINVNEDEEENFEEQVRALGDILKSFWTSSFKERYPNKIIIIDIYDEWDSTFITVFQGD